MAKIRILISGGGPAGLAVGILLNKSKYEVSLVERENHFMNMGFSIILWKAGHDILQKLIQLKKIPGVYPLNKFSIYGGQDPEHLQSSDTEGIGFSIKREDLMSQLAKRYLEECSQQSVRFNSFVKDTNYNIDSSINVTFSDDTEDAFDLILAADGIHSGIRSTHFDSKIESKPFKITYGWIKPGSKLKEEAIIGFMKNYLYLIQTVGDEALIAYYHSGDEKEDELFLDRLNTLIERERGGELKLDQSSMKNYPAEEVIVEKAYDKRVVLVGDSFHGHTPTLGMGTSMALEDSWTLTQLLNGIDTDTGKFDDEVEGVLSKYNSHRHARLMAVYGTQNGIEKLLITASEYKVEVAESILKYGGWKVLEPLLHGISKG
jgi:2-polyprenyl-6-methoxyphenol hydroxylase-like FAD-dependent oxidoreductase